MFVSKLHIYMEVYYKAENMDMYFAGKVNS